MNLEMLNSAHMYDELLAAGTAKKRSDTYRFARSLRASEYMECGLKQAYDLLCIEPEERTETDEYTITASIGKAIHDHTQDRLKWAGMAYPVLYFDRDKEKQRSKRNPLYLLNTLEKAKMLHLLPEKLGEEDLDKVVKQSFLKNAQFQLQEHLLYLAFQGALALDPEKEAVVDQLESVLLASEILKPSIEQYIEDFTDEEGNKERKELWVDGIEDATLKRRKLSTGKRSLFELPFPTEIKTLEGTYWNYKTRTKEYVPADKYWKKVAHFEAQLQVYLHFYRTPSIYGERRKVTEGLLYIIDRSNPVNHVEVYKVTYDPLFIQGQFDRLRGIIAKIKNKELPDPEPNLSYCPGCIRKNQCPATESQKAGNPYRFTKPR